MSPNITQDSFLTFFLFWPRPKAADDRRSFIRVIGVIRGGLFWAARSLPQKRNNRVIFTTNARLRSSNRSRGSSGLVFCSSVHTTKNSLPGRYSHRKRTLLLKVRSTDEYCSSALANMRGEKP